VVIVGVFVSGVTVCVFLYARALIQAQTRCAYFEVQGGHAAPYARS